LKSFEKNKEKIDDLSDVGLNGFIDNQITIFQEVMNTIDEQMPTTKTGDDVKESKNPKDFTKAENNEFLEEDVDPDFYSSFDDLEK
jgi:hypothetical protein